MSLDEGHRLVLSAFSDARIAYNENFRFEFLVDSIRLQEHRAEEGESDAGIDEEEAEREEDEAGLWEYRTAAMSLVNSIANSPNDLEQRMVLREEFARRGLNEAMAVSLSNLFNRVSRSADDLASLTGTTLCESS